MSSIKLDHASKPAAGNFSAWFRNHPRSANLAPIFCTAAVAVCTSAINAPAAVIVAGTGATVGLLFPTFFGFMGISECCVVGKPGRRMRLWYGGVTAAAALAVGASIYPQSMETVALQNSFDEMVRHCPAARDDGYSLKTDHGSAAKVFISPDFKAVMREVVVRGENFWTGRPVEQRLTYSKSADCAPS